MAHDPNTLKKAAVLTGLTMLIGGAEISNAAANTISQTDDFPPPSMVGIPIETVPGTLSFNGFNSSLGNLTQVEVVLNSTLTNTFPDGHPPTSLTASVSLSNGQYSSSAMSVGGYNDDVTLKTSLSLFETPYTAALSLFISDGAVTWAGSTNSSNTSHPDAGLTVIYTFTPTSTTPLPATLPLFATGLAGLGFTTWRRRRKLTTKE